MVVGVAGRRLAPVLFALALALPLVPSASAVGGPGTAWSPSPDASNLPAGCANSFSDGCYHMRTGLNGLDSPQIDVLLLVPASPWVERDLRAMRAAVETWDTGLHQLASEEGLGWFSGVDFHISVDRLGAVYGGSGEFTTYPVVDPEIVVVLADPVVGGVQGIGIDPHATAGQVGLDVLFGGQSPCHGVANPFDVEAWRSLPGFDSHHDGRGGTYSEDCDGAGGNVCFAVNLGIDPVPTVVDDVLGMNVHDLVGHEVGHCLSLGHVGDAGDHSTTVWPRDDIMSYTHDAGISGRKCASLLDLQAFATTMSRFLDVDGDGGVDAADRLYPNDHRGDLATSAAGNPMQVQHPSAERYASPSGRASDCAVPDTGLVPASLLAPPQPPGASDPTLRNGEPKDVHLEAINSPVLEFVVPAGATILQVDADQKCEVPEEHAVEGFTPCATETNLHVQYGSPPNLDEDPDCLDAGIGENHCTLRDPQAGTWYVELASIGAAGIITVTATAWREGCAAPAPSIYDVRIDVAANAVRARWSTDTLANTRLTATPASGPAKTLAASAQTVAHAITLTGLSPSTAYDLQLQSTGCNGAAGLVQPVTTAAANADSDGDGVQDTSDVCDWDADPRQADSDGDRAGDRCDDDIDGDGLRNKDDADRDGDGLHNTAEANLGQDPDAPVVPVPVLCLPSAKTHVRVQDKDGDGVPAVYGVGAGQKGLRVHTDGTYRGAGAQPACWLAGDPDDDGTLRGPIAAARQPALPGPAQAVRGLPLGLSVYGG